MSRTRSQAAESVLFGVAQVAAALGVTTETVRRYIRENKLNATKVARQGLKKEWGISKEDLRTFCAGRGVALDLEKLVAQ